MSRIKWTEKKIAQRQAEGYGQGRGSAYKPWLEVKDVGSHGRARRVWSHKTGRVHHLFSDVEMDIFVAAEWANEVIDIREQFPLDRELTQTIAQELGIRHPYYPGTDIPTVMTVDFMLSISDGGETRALAINAKRDEEAEDERSLQKLEIQRTYFERLEVEHHLMYHSRAPKQKLKNIYWLRDAQLSEGEIEPRPGFYNLLKSKMGHELTACPYGELTLQGYCADFDMRQGIESGTGLRVARMLMQERALMADLNAPSLIDEPLAHFQMTGRRGQLRAMGAQ